MGKPKKEKNKREKQEEILGSKKIQRIMGNQDLEREYSGIKKEWHHVWHSIGDGV